MTLSASNVETVYQALKPHIRRTPLIRSEELETYLGVKHPIYLKLESLQYTGSFKVRGSLAKLLSIQEKAKKKGVVTASAGNHAQGVAFHCHRLGIDAKIVMPLSTPLVKVKATKSYGASVVLRGESYQEAETHAHDLEKSEGREYVHAFDDPDVVLGQGSVGLEVLEDLPKLQNFIAPIGGGGLLGGSSLYLKEKNPGVKIYGVQASGASTLLPSLKAGKPVQLDKVNTFAEGISAKRLGDLTFDLLKNNVDQSFTVSDEAIAQGILWILENQRLFVEGCAGAVIAAVFQNPDIITGPTALVMSGGNLDVNLLSRIIERGLVRSGRLIEIEVILDDVPGSLESLVNVIAAQNASIMEVKHERAFSSTDLKEVSTRIRLETSGPKHLEKLREALKNQGFRVNFN